MLQLEGGQIWLLWRVSGRERLPGSSGGYAREYPYAKREMQTTPEIFITPRVSLFRQALPAGDREGRSY
jgi:hypothetical protein